MCRGTAPKPARSCSSSATGRINPLAVKVATRNIPLYRDPAVMLIDQLKEIYIAGELDIVETANWNPKVTRRDYMVGMENTGDRGGRRPRPAILRKLCLRS